MVQLITGLFFPSKEREWRISVSFLVCIFGGLTMANTWLMWGLFPVSLFFSGFATAGAVEDASKDIDKVQKTIERQSQQIERQSQQSVRDKDEIKALILLGQLNQIFDAMCGAIRGRRSTEADQWERQFTDKIIEYNRISGTVYPMRNCG